MKNHDQKVTGKVSTKPVDNHVQNLPALALTAQSH